MMDLDYPAPDRLIADQHGCQRIDHDPCGLIGCQACLDPEYGLITDLEQHMSRSNQLADDKIITDHRSRLRGH
jgi:hypothetical protein